MLGTLMRGIQDLLDLGRADQRQLRHRPQITDRRALLATDQIIVDILFIGPIGLVGKLAFKAANRRLLPWAQPGR